MTLNSVSSNMVVVEHLNKNYQSGEKSLNILKNISCKILQGEFVSIVGPSGSGKSTLLYLMGGLDLPSSGKITIAGNELSQLSDKKLAQFRREHIGFVFQSFHLLPTLTALENVMIPALLCRNSMFKISQKAMQLLDQVGMKSRAHHFPAQLSGGEMQRVALARALVNSPAVILADEATGNLDSKTGDAVLELLMNLVKIQNVTLIFVTHDAKVAQKADRIISLKDGEIVSL